MKHTKNINKYFIQQKKTTYNNKKVEQFFKSFTKNFNISEEYKELIDDLTLLFNSKIYEMDLIIIIFFSNVWEKIMNGIKKYQINMKNYLKWIHKI